jgi:hypothetical protein
MTVSHLARLTSEMMHEMPIAMGTLTSWLGVLFALFTLILLISLLCLWRGRNAYVLGVPPDPLSASCYGPGNQQGAYGGYGVSGVAPIGVVSPGFGVPGAVSVGY